MEERRRYFRINDQIIAVLEPIDYDSFIEAGQALQQGQSSQDNQQQALQQLEREIQQRIKQLRDVAADFADVLQLINNKVNVLSHSLPQFAQDVPDISQEPLREVNLSGSGMALYQDQPLSIGQHVRVHILLPDTFQDILCYATVVRSNSRGHDQYLIGMDFSYIQDMDQEAIIKHVMRRQTEQLRARRAAKADADALKNL